MKITVENEFWALFPEAQISVLVAKGLDNRVDESKDPYFKSLLDKGAKRAADFIPDENFTQNDVIQPIQDQKRSAFLYRSPTQAGQSRTGI